MQSASEDNSCCFELAMRLTCICVQIDLRSITALQLRERLLNCRNILQQKPAVCLLLLAPCLLRCCWLGVAECADSACLTLRCCSPCSAIAAWRIGGETC